MGLFNASYHWLLLNPSSSFIKHPFSTLSTLSINMNSEVTVAQRRNLTIPNGNSVRIYDLFDVWYVLHKSYLCIRALQKNWYTISHPYIYMFYYFTSSHNVHRRSPGTRFGGQVHINRLAVYESSLNEFRIVERTGGVSTIVRRMDMQAVPLRCMIVVCIHRMRKMVWLSDCEAFQSFDLNGMWC